jgi:hypothetical protein
MAEYKNVKIVSVTVVTAIGGTDTLLLNTTLPAGAYPFEGNAVFHLAVARKLGETYCKENFPGVPYTIVG